MTSSAESTTTRYLTRPDGRVSYDVAGDGPLVVLAPGMGDLRSSYRLLAPRLRAAGYRVAVTDLRGHGEADTTFASYGDADTAGDLAALVAELGGPAVLVGNSMAAGAAVIAAADRPDLVAGLVLLGPFVRPAATSAAARLALRVLMQPAWAATAWKAYLPSLYAGARPADFDAYRGQVVAALRRPGYARAFVATSRTDHAAAAGRLAQVSAPTVVVMGEKDPDFPDPRAEAAWIADALRGTAVLVPDAGHYPQSQQPDAVAAATLDLLARVAPHA